MSKHTLKRGMTLIEVIIAMALLAVILVSIMPSLGLYSKVNSQSQDIDSTNALASQELETIRVITLTSTFAQLKSSLVASNGYTLQSADASTAVFTKMIDSNSVNVQVSANPLTNGEVQLNMVQVEVGVTSAKAVKAELSELLNIQAAP